SRIGMTFVRVLAVALGIGTGLPLILVFGLSSSIEGLSRYVGMRRVPQVRERLDRRVATVYGLGHGGFESILLGLWLLATGLAVVAGLTLIYGAATRDLSERDLAGDPLAGPAAGEPPDSEVVGVGPGGAGRS